MRSFAGPHRASPSHTQLGVNEPAAKIVLARVIAQPVVRKRRLFIGQVDDPQGKGRTSEPWVRWRKHGTCVVAGAEVEDPKTAQFVGVRWKALIVRVSTDKPTGE